jgi:hypothetical protein
MGNFSFEQFEWNSVNPDFGDATVWITAVRRCVARLA